MYSKIEKGDLIECLATCARHGKIKFKVRQPPMQQLTSVIQRGMIGIVVKTPSAMYPTYKIHFLNFGTSFFMKPYEIRKISK